MSGFIYSLCAITALFCAFLLLRSYFRTKSRLLLWCGLCFVGLLLNNVLLIIDRIFLPEQNFETTRLIPAVLGMILLIYGLIWETD